MSFEELNESHRKQRKELQAKVQGLKKSITKGDKKRKKEIDVEIERLEKKFEEKCQLELKEFEEVSRKSAKGVQTSSAVSSEIANDSGQATSVGGDGGEIGKKTSKAQKRREKKEKSQVEREIEIEKYNLHFLTKKLVGISDRSK